MRLVAPNDTMREVDVRRGGRVKRFGQIVDVTDRADVKALREAGYTAVGLGNVRASVGFICPCGFRPFFKTCSRCGRHLDD
jgi:hypothetical protein